MLIHLMTIFAQIWDILHDENGTFSFCSSLLCLPGHLVSPTKVFLQQLSFSMWRPSACWERITRLQRARARASMHLFRPLQWNLWSPCQRLLAATSSLPLSLRHHIPPSLSPSISCSAVFVMDSVDCILTAKRLGWPGRENRVRQRAKNTVNTEAC